MPDVIKVTNLKKVYPPINKKGEEFVAVNGISFRLKKGEIVGLLGPNGAGKSTTIYMLLGVLSPTEGKIEYFGKDFMANRSQVLEDVTFASTYIRMPWRLTVMENLRVYGYMYGLNRDQFDKRVEKFLRRFGVWEQRNKTMNNLSAGQVTRVMLAKAFIPHPKIALLDEPTASLDPEIAHQIRTFVKEQQQEFGTSMIYTSHNMDEVADVCDRVIFLKRGQIVAEDTPDNLTNSMDLVRIKLTMSSKEKAGFQKEKWDFDHKLGRAGVEIEVEKKRVAQILQTLAKKGVGYEQVKLEEPNLEDYFLRQSQDRS